MRISIIGAGYVGLSNAVLLSTKYDVICYDIDKAKVDLINDKKSPIKDKLISQYLRTKKISLKATSQLDLSIFKSKIIIISTPTNFDNKKNKFDTSSIDQILKKLSSKKVQSTIVIKSTVSIGYTESVCKKYKKLKIYFSPEFLREGKALEDNLYPSRIIIGGNDKYSREFIQTIKSVALKKNIKTLYMSNSEAESVKLFSNTYLATRVSFFNELDSFCLEKKLDSKSIIDGLSSDSRIGDIYNNPSFGFGGYCLPKDTKQLRSSFGNIPNALIKSLGNSNRLRKKHIVNDILKLKYRNIGIYLLAMKKDSDNFRESSIIDIIKLLRKSSKNIFIYEPLLNEKKTIFGCNVLNDFEKFLKKSDIIITNRYSHKLNKVSNKVYTRDIYGEN